MDKVIEIIMKLITNKFTGDIIIHFNNGGIQGIKEAKYDSLK